MIDLVIVAGGLGSRLTPMTNHIPKFLVNIGKETGYVEMIRYWDKCLGLSYSEDDVITVGGSSLTVIVHPAYVDLIQAYHNLYFPTIRLIIKTVDKANGSAHAILTSCDHLVGRSVLFSWCDVIPVDEINQEELWSRFHDNNVVFTNYDNSNRYELLKTGSGWADVAPHLSPTEKGGIFGLYYINKFKTDVSYADGQDFVEVLQQYGSLREWRLSRIIDFGDKPKLERTRDKADGARSFNSIETVGDYVKKTALTSQGRTVMRKEIKWYEAIASADIGDGLRTPKTWISPTYDSFFMERVKGIPIWQAWPRFSDVDKLFVVNQLLESSKSVASLTATDPGANLERDVRIEALTKLEQRYAEIEQIIKAFGDVKTVSVCQSKSFGTTLKYTPQETFVRLHAKLAKHYTEAQPKYGVIHGDLQFSNSLVDLNTRQVRVIDPRGYFGQTAIYGLHDYDRAKVLYSLSGYDTFNYARDFGIVLDAGQLSFNVQNLDAPQSVLDQFDDVHRMWLAVCWLGLAQYIKNDPVKCVAAHYYGMVLAQEIIDR